MSDPFGGLFRPDGSFDWAAAETLQRELAAKVLRTGTVDHVCIIGGVDVSVPYLEAAGRAAIVVLTFPALQPVEIQTAAGPLRIPYRAGFLSFRETPLVLKAFEQLALRPDLLLVDGQGIAHPRRLGIASHVGAILDLPTAGCAKSPLAGRPAGELGPAPGDTVDLIDRDEVVGRAVRTRRGAKPLYVSVGHRVGLDEAVELVLGCTRGYRLPEPTRLAHLAAAGRFQL